MSDGETPSQSPPDSAPNPPVESTGFLSCLAGFAIGIIVLFIIVLFFVATAPLRFL